MSVGGDATSFIESPAGALSAIALMAFAVGVLTWGHLPLLFDASISGVSSVFLAVGIGAAASLMGSTAVAGHAVLADAKRLDDFEIASAQLVAACWCAAIGVLVLEAYGVSAFARPVALAPQADWLFFPLPWIWESFLGLATEKAAIQLLLGGCCCAVLVFISAPFSNRLGFVFLGMLVCMAGAYLLGEASLLYAGSRMLGPVASPDLALLLRSDAGAYNAWNFHYWLAGLYMVMLGTLVIARQFARRKTLPTQEKI